MEALKKTTYYTLMIISCLIFLWILASWGNTVMHNTTDYVYASWNLFEILCR